MSKIREQREQNRVLDTAARYRRQKKALDALEQDNVQDEPYADLVMSKKAPKFQETLEPASRGPPEKKNKRKNRRPEYYRQKYRRTIEQLIDDDLVNSDGPNYLTVVAPPSQYPARNFCGACGLFGPYTCVQCGIRYCSVRCLGQHRDTRCLKWTS